MIRAIVSAQDIEVTFTQAPTVAVEVVDRELVVGFAQPQFLTTRVEQSPVTAVFVANENEEVSE